MYIFQGVRAFPWEEGRYYWQRSQGDRFYVLDLFFTPIHELPEPVRVLPCWGLSFPAATMVPRIKKLCVFKKTAEGVFFEMSSTTEKQVLYVKHQLAPSDRVAEKLILGHMQFKITKANDTRQVPRWAPREGYPGGFVLSCSCYDEDEGKSRTSIFIKCFMKLLKDRAIIPVLSGVPTMWQEYLCSSSHHYRCMMSLIQETDEVRKDLRRIDEESGVEAARIIEEELEFFSDEGEH